MASIFFFILGLLFLLVLGYLYFLAVFSLLPWKKYVPGPPALRFAIVIPAHNEADLIAATLEATAALDYPAALYEIIVVADNCSDATEKIARAHGATCLVRTDAAARGKGNVLRWVFPQLLRSGDHDGFVVIDADSHLDPEFLLRVNHYFLQGEQAVQGYSQVRHPECSPMESLAFLGFALNRNLRYRGRSRLGWTSNLLGTGMCFQRQVLEKYGWNTTTMVEDIEYEMMLKLHGVRVLFAPDTRLNVELHSSVSQSGGQRTRWDLGKFEVRNRYLLPLLRQGIRHKDPSCFDCAMELLLPPFSLLCVGILAGCLLFAVAGYSGVDLNFYIWLIVLFGLLLYIFIGLITARANWRVYRSLCLAPFFIIWRFWIVVRESLGPNRNRQW
jgi:cellulose synthase/poly-beta-1,6-N-acetylglucosamine synthase-like glycosyltransferase